jgi:tRNA threonylcarbamoyl adenosine modification protein YeaZ
MTMILVIDTSSAACTAALFDGETCVDSRQEILGRGHSERLVPMLDEMLDGRTAAKILVGVGPGSFTGIRVGIAAAHGLAIGWGAAIAGLSSLALLAAAHEGPVAAAVNGGHGELFVQQFNTFSSPGPVRNLVPAEAAIFISAPLIAGSGAEALIEARGWGEAGVLYPSPRIALSLPHSLRSLPPVPFYGRAPDAKLRSAA